MHSELENAYFEPTPTRSGRTKMGMHMHMHMHMTDTFDLLCKPILEVPASKIAIYSFRGAILRKLELHKGILIDVRSSRTWEMWK